MAAVSVSCPLLIERGSFYREIPAFLQIFADIKARTIDTDILRYQEVNGQTSLANVNVGATGATRVLWRDTASMYPVFFTLALQVF